MSGPSSPFPPETGAQRPVCVFCGSSPGSSALYGHAASSVGKALAEAGIPMVYGGGIRGLMGTVSQATLDAGGYVHGIVPGALTERNMADSRLPPLSAANSTVGKSVEGKGKEVVKGDSERFTMEVVGSMHERKLRMAKLATGGFVVLPGGYGTFEEMMEMITWNQLGIHRLPVIVLNIGNLFSPLRTLLQGAVEAGFIQEENLALVHILDLPGGSEANSNEDRVAEWGPATVKALNEWSLSHTAGYGIKWELGRPDRNLNDVSVQDETHFSLFTTMRYTSPDLSRPTLPITKDQIPLLEYHFDRLETAFAHFSHRDGTSIWGVCPGRDQLWQKLSDTLNDRESQEQGDWRVRLLIHRGGGIEVQVVPAPANAGPFQLHPTAGRSPPRTLLLDSIASDIAVESSQQRDLRLYKTTKRQMYDEASTRAAAARPDLDHPEVLLHTPTHLLETATSNIAIQFPKPSGQTWITPKLDVNRKPFLDGVMRRYLLDKGLIREQELTLDYYYQARREGYRVIGFNGLRGVWEAELL